MNTTEPSASELPGVLRAACEAAARVDCGQCTALTGDECVYTTNLAGPMRGYHATRFALAERRGLISAVDLETVTAGLFPAAVVWDNGDAPRQPVAAEEPENLAAWLRSHTDRLGKWLTIWAARDDSKPDARARRCASDAVGAIDSALADCTRCGKGSSARSGPATTPQPHGSTSCSPGRCRTHREPARQACSRIGPARG